MIENPLNSELVQSRAFRRAVAFVVGIGVPALAALWFRQSGGMLLGVITAIMFSFADEEGPLTKRFTALGRSAAGIALGGAIGHLLGGYDWAFWLLFVAGAFGAAWLNRADKSAHIGARLAVMALAIAAGTPDISWREASFAVGSLAVTVLVRLADHAVFGPLPAASLPPRPVVPESDRFWLRFAAAYTAAATLGLWIGLELDRQHAIWVVVTTLVVMQPDDRSNYRRILERIVGTLAGVAVAFVLTQFLRAEPLVFAALVVTAAALPHHIPVRYWLHTAAIALLVMLIYDLASRVAGDSGALAPGLFTERVVDVLVGCVLALIGTELGFRWGAHVKPASVKTAPAQPD
jgi:uncharacterized membrane protein YccC